MSQQSRRFTITINNYTDDHRAIPEYLKEHAKGIIWGRERGETNGTPHIQGYLYTSVKHTLSGLLKKIPEAFRNRYHIELCKGNSFQNYTYCTKEGDYEEFGEIPKDGFPKDPSKKRDTEAEWSETLTLAKDGRFEEISAEKRIRFYDTLKKIETDHRGRPSDLERNPGIWLVGPAGFGKSWSARRDFGTAYYTKGWGKWWPSYNGEDTVILDDVSPEHAKHLQDDLKIWGDIYPFNAETKGGFTGLIRPQTVVVTSQYTINQVFNDTKTREAISRRFRVINLTKCQNPKHYDEVGTHDDSIHPGTWEPATEEMAGF